MPRIRRRSVALSTLASLTGTVLITAGCTSSEQAGENHSIAVPSQSSASYAAPSTTAVAPEPSTIAVPSQSSSSYAAPSTTAVVAPKPSTSAENDANWIAAANHACQAAIDTYQHAKAGGSADPTGRAIAASQAVVAAADDVEGLPAPSSSSAKALASQIRAHAKALGEVAYQMENGAISDEEQAGARAEDSGAALSSTSSKVGTPACASMTQEV
jgi:hypothetical protein